MMKDTKVDKWLLRKGQPIVAQISVVLVDPNIFSDPKSFRPERFLDENGNLLKSDHLIPFGLGKRQCLGESLARMELFLFFANIFNRYMVNILNTVNTLIETLGLYFSMCLFRWAYIRGGLLQEAGLQLEYLR
ncbi:unnamed protein product [Meloidogyne enterolobii]|uniref:Uncharacterized protein n=1 Tax=Meloidogyne enterolobii TaxID=390850 RepID=A0ACB0XQF6_MELEN